MIFNFVLHDQFCGLKLYSQSWAPELLSQVQAFSYNNLSRLREVPAGTCVFSDFEFLTPTVRDVVIQIADQIDRSGESIRVLNHPAQLLTRYTLLTRLHETGKNTYRVRRASDDCRDLRFPVFVRHIHEHWGSLSDLLDGVPAMEAALARLAGEGYAPQDLMVVEYCDTSDRSGLFRKYSAFQVAGQIVPRHLIFSRNWVQRTPDLLDGEKLAEEKDYLETNPHREWLREVFAVAGVDYGRADYGICQGKPQLWEINTNPWVLLFPHEYQPEHMPAQRYFAGRVAPLIEDMARAPENSAPVPITVSGDLCRRIEVEGKSRVREQRLATWRRALLKAPLLGVVLRVTRISDLAKWALHRYRGVRFERRRAKAGSPAD